MMKAAVLLALVASSNACCGLAFTTCCQAYAPPRIIGYERIPLYAKVPVQQAPPPPPSYPIAPPVMQAPPMPIQEITAPLPQQQMIMQQPTYFAPAPTVVVQEQPRTVVQPFIVHETPYQPQPVVVQEMPAAVPAVQTIPVRVQTIPQVALPVQSSYAQPAVGLAQPTVVQPVMPTAIETNAVDFNGPVQVPTARALKLRRQYLKQVKV